eukprot:3941025-Rhodomonas_salina.1
MTIDCSTSPQPAPSKQVMTSTVASHKEPLRQPRSRYSSTHSTTPQSARVYLAGVDAHRVEVLHVADGHAVVVGVTHDLRWTASIGGAPRSETDVVVAGSQVSNGA